MADVFISHVEADGSVALELVRGLEDAGYATWCYENEGLPGVSYLEATGTAIESARAFLLLVSAASLGSKQVDSEVVRAHECGKPIVPVLLDMSHAEFQRLKPAWRQAVGSATSLQVRAGEVSTALPRLIRGLQALGIRSGRPTGGARTADLAPRGHAGPAPLAVARGSERTGKVGGRSEADSRAAVPAGRARSRRFFGLLAVSGLALAVTIWFVLRSSPPKAEVRQTPLTSLPAEDALLSAAISPDGDYLAFADATGYYLLRIQTRQVSALAGAERVPLPGKTGDVQLAWFPDGRSLLIGTSIQAAGVTQDSLWHVLPLEHRAYLLREGFREPAVSSDGRIVCVATEDCRQALWVMEPDGSEARRLMRPGESGVSYSHATWSMTGRRVAYLKSLPDDPDAYRVDSRKVATHNVLESCDMEGGDDTPILGDEWLGAGWRAARCICWLPDGRLLYCLPDSEQSQDRVDVWSIAVDPSSGSVEGSASRAFSVLGGQAWDLTSSADGKRLALVRGRSQLDVYICALEDGGRGLGQPRRLTLDEHNDTPIGWTPDGKDILFVSVRAQSANVYRQGIDQRYAATLLEPPSTTQYAALTGGGGWILYHPDPTLGGERPDGLVRLAETGGAPVVIPGSDSTWFPVQCGCRAGATCVFSRLEGDECVFYRLDPMEWGFEESARVEVPPGDWRSFWYLSPDGQAVALEVGGSTRVIDLRTGSEFSPLPADRDSLELLGWAADGGLWLSHREELGDRVFHADLSGVTRDVGVLDYFSTVCASPDGRYLAFDHETHEANAWLVEGY